MLLTIQENPSSMGAYICGKHKSGYDIDTLGSLPRFLPKIQYGIVVKVVDGDTIHVASPLGTSWYKFSVRVLGVDTPEIHSKDQKERDAAYLAKKFVVEHCLHKRVTFCEHVREKYGRVCAKVILPDGRDLAKVLIKENLGNPYSGGTKIAFASLSDRLKNK